jgi:hypothetical protein
MKFCSFAKLLGREQGRLPNWSCVLPSTIGVVLFPSTFCLWIPLSFLFSVMTLFRTPQQTISKYTVFEASPIRAWRASLLCVGCRTLSRCLKVETQIAPVLALVAGTINPWPPPDLQSQAWNLIHILTIPLVMGIQQCQATPMTTLMTASCCLSLSLQKWTSSLM